MPEQPNEAGHISFHFIKSAAFRVVHVDGAIGGLTPSANIHCALYNERPAIPQRVDLGIKEDGQLIDPGVQVGKSGIVREVEVDLMMTRHVAERLRDWLNERLKDWDEAAGSGAWEADVLETSKPVRRGRARSVSQKSS